MGPTTKTHGMDRISWIGWTEAQKRPWVHYVDTWPFFSDVTVIWARDLAENADPFTKRRLLDLAQRYDLKSRPGAPGGRTLPPPRATRPTALFSGSGEA